MPKVTDDMIFEWATALGCKPIWFDGIFGWHWHCDCKNNDHGMDHQCSLINKGSLDRFRKRGWIVLTPYVPSAEDEARRCEHGYIMWENSCNICRVVRLGLKNWEFSDAD